MKVHVAIPNCNYVHKEVLRAVLYMREFDCGHKLSWNLQTEKPIDNNRNLIIRQFLQHEEKFDYLLFMDSDNPPMENKNPLSIVEKGLDVVVFPTPIWVHEAKRPKECAYPIVWNCFDWSEPDNGWKEHQDKKGISPVDAGGSGCMLIRREVLEVVKPAFMREWDEDGVVKRGSDLLFCRRAREAGFRVDACYDIPCLHFKERELANIVKTIGDCVKQYGNNGGTSNGGTECKRGVRERDSEVVHGSG